MSKKKTVVALAFLVLTILSVLAFGWAHDWSRRVVYERWLEPRDVREARLINRERRLDLLRGLNALSQKFGKTIDELLKDDKEESHLDVDEYISFFAATHPYINVSAINNHTSSTVEGLHRELRKSQLEVLASTVGEVSAKCLFFLFPLLSCIARGIYGYHTDEPWRFTLAYVAVCFAFSATTFCMSQVISAFLDVFLIKKAMNAMGIGGLAVDFQKPNILCAIISLIVACVSLFAHTVLLQTFRDTRAFSTSSTPAQKKQPEVAIAATSTTCSPDIRVEVVTRPLPKPSAPPLVADEEIKRPVAAAVQENPQAEGQPAAAVVAPVTNADDFPVRRVRRPRLPTFAR